MPMESMYCLTARSAEETRDIGIRMGRWICPPFSIALKGDLGAGKTCFAQGLARGLGVPEEYYITSPSYSILNEYPAEKCEFWHLDLYRLGCAEELDFLGMDRAENQPVVMAVEWPDFLRETGVVFDLEMDFICDEKDRRIIGFSGTGQAGKNLLENLSSILCDFHKQPRADW